MRIRLKIALADSRCRLCDEVGSRPENAGDFCALDWCGLELDWDKNRTLIELEGKLSTAGSTLQALVVLTEEGLQIAHDCVQAL
jgi:hypothetical protein